MAGEVMPTKTIKARHPHWSLDLILSQDEKKIVTLRNKDAGTYQVEDNGITIFWNDFPKETFEFFDGIYYKKGMIVHGLSNTSAKSCVLYNKKFDIDSIGVKIPGQDFSIKLRMGTSDLPTFQQIFIDNEYNSNNLPHSATTIIDLGANIGLASIFFAMRYPEAKIISVEPDPDNFEMLKENVKSFGDRITPIFGAAWFEDTKLNLRRTTPTGSELGAWGVQVEENTDGGSGEVNAYSISKLIGMMGKQIDIIKIDVEGAELEIFSNNAEEWISGVELVIVETHDRFRPGSDQAVRNALQGKFVELPRKGENIFFKNALV